MTSNSKDEPERKSGNEQVEGLRRGPVNQGGHAGLAGHGGQQSGGMGGMHGGDLHDSGSAQSGMTGGAGMGGNDRDRKGNEDPASADAAGNEQRAAPAENTADRLQSAQREGMGQHRHRGRHQAQDLDASDANDLGSRDKAAPDAPEADQP